MIYFHEIMTYFHRFLKETINGLSADTLRFVNVDLIVFGVFAQGIISYVFIISIILAFTSAHAFGLSPFVPSCCTVVSVGKETYPMHVPTKPFHFSERNGCLRLQCFRTCVVNSTCVVLCKHICVPPLYLFAAGHD